MKANYDAKRRGLVYTANNGVEMFVPDEQVAHYRLKECKGWTLLLALAQIITATRHE